MSGPRRPTLGFGFDPVESPYHFVVLVPRALTEPARLEERFTWEEAGRDDDEPRPPVEKAKLPRSTWDLIAPALRGHFADRLRRAGQRAAEWRTGENLLAPYFGKEATLLAWAVEDESDEGTLSRMLANWLGFMPEERWWLYATVNASFDQPYPAHGHDRGWRGAIKKALSENPISVQAPALGALKEREPAAKPERRKKPREAATPQLALFEQRNGSYGATGEAPDSAVGSEATPDAMRGKEPLAG